MTLKQKTDSRDGRKRRRWSLVLLGLVGVVLVVGYFVIIAMLPSAIVYAPNTKKTINPLQDPDSERLKKLGASSHQRVAVGPPKASVSCLVIDPPSGTIKGTVAILHGIGDQKRSMLGTASFLAKRGLRAVLCDHRGHGRSSGRFLTYGVVEASDMKQVFDHLEKEKLLVGNVGAVGFSYGGSVAIHWAAKDHRVKAVVSVSTYASLRQVLRSYIRRESRLASLLISDGQLDNAMAEAGRIAAFDPTRADTTRAMKRSKAQVLIIHGERDRKIPVAQGRAIHQAARARSELLILAEDHVSIMKDRDGIVKKRMERWLLRWLLNNPS